MTTRTGGFMSRFSLSAPRPQPKAAKRGEINELRTLLREPGLDKDPAKKRDALKRVIAYMTLGIDTTLLFSEMIMASATKDLVQKKMVYLFMTTHAESNDETAILVINTLQKDCKDESPLVRGLALRSLSSLKLPSIVEYLQPFVKAGLTDKSGYVRKTAVIAAGKLWRNSKEAFKAMGLSEKLYGLIKDGESSVCCNALMILTEVLADEGGINITKQLIYYLLNRMRDLNEWQQCLVLNLVLKYVPETEDEMYNIMNLMEERLKGSNSAVILAATNVFLSLTQNVPQLHRQVYERLRDPLMTLVSTSPLETSYAVLAHIKLLISREPTVFAGHYKDFYVRYTDPHYIRALKLDILVAIATEKNMKEIIEELSIFATDIQAETARASIRALGQIALKLPAAAEECTKYFLEFLDTEQEHVRAETFIMLKDFMRKYTDVKRLRPFFTAIVKNWKSIDDKESKVAFAWMLGEFGSEIEDAPYILEHFASRFTQEPYMVRIELLTACMKLFFQRPPEMQPILGPLLHTACSDFSHADVHDRALLYYRLLQYDPRKAALVVNSPKQPILAFVDTENPEIKDKLFEEFNTLSVVYNQPSERFIRHGDVCVGAGQEEEEASSSESEDEEEESEEDEESDEEDVRLQDCTIDSAVFQGKWTTLPVVEELRFKLRTQPEADAFERLLENSLVHCMASGQVQSSVKFYFYAQSSGSTGHILAETLVDIGGNVNATIKGDDPAVKNFSEIFKAALRPLM